MSLCRGVCVCVIKTSYLFPPTKANGIIKKLQVDVRGLAEKIKVKNSVTVSQEKVVQDTSEKLQTARRRLQDAQQQLTHKDEQVAVITSISIITISIISVEGGADCRLVQ